MHFIAVQLFCIGIMIGHVSPEAYVGGPIAMVQNGDTISIDVNSKTLHLVWNFLYYFILSAKICKRLQMYHYSLEVVVMYFLTGYISR